MKKVIHTMFWSSCVGFVVLATHPDRVEAVVCSTVGSGPVCTYSYDVDCNPITFECRPIIYEYREVITRPINGPDPI